MSSINDDDGLWSNLDAERLQQREEYSMLCCWQVCCWHVRCCWKLGP